MSHDAVSYYLRRYWREAAIFFVFASVLFGPTLLSLLAKQARLLELPTYSIRVSYRL